MGVTRWLDRIDPKIWNQACEQIAIDLPANRAGVVCFLARYGRKADEFLLDEVDDAAEEGPLDSMTLNSVLEAAVTEEHWDLDKSLSLVFGYLPEFIPSTRPLMKIIHFKGIDIKIPDLCNPIDAGLFGCCSSQSITDCLEVVRHFESTQALKSALPSAGQGFFSKLTGRPGRIKKLVERLDDEYYEENWAKLRAAIESTVAREHYLGLCLSP